MEKHLDPKPQALATTAPTDPAFSGQWVPLLEYSVQTGVSLSTLRRYIKSGRLEFRIEDGRYLLPLPQMVNNEGGATSSPSAVLSRPATPKSGSAEVARLEMELRKAREENAELRMLVALYEESLSSGPSRGGTNN